MCRTPVYGTSVSNHDTCVMDTDVTCPNLDKSILHPTGVRGTKVLDKTNTIALGNFLPRAINPLHPTRVMDTNSGKKFLPENKLLPTGVMDTDLRYTGVPHICIKS